MKDRISLILQAGAGEKAVEVGEDQNWSSFLVGRSDEADLFLNDPGVSRRHCRLFRRPRSIAIEDLGSSAGTLVNGEPLTTSRGVHDGDELQIGSIVLRVRIENDAPVDAEPAPAPPPSAPVQTPPPPLPDDATMVASAAPKAEPKPGEHIRVDLTRRPIVSIGRDEACEVTLDYPVISRRQTEIRAEARGFLIRDLGSTNGTFVNGERLTGLRELEPGDVVGIGPHRLTFDGTSLYSERPPESGTRIETRGLGKQVIHRETGKPFYLLQGIDLTIEPKEFVGLLGPSGCGKSTFMDTVNGRRPATEGTVLYNGENLYNRFDAFKQGIGYVPQDVIFHEDLPLVDVLRYASRLRLPDDTSDREIENNIDSVLETVGLAKKKASIVKTVSGGQKKRISIAIELLARPTLLFLDEVTSGLDAAAEVDAMRLFRDLADGGVTTMCITHWLDSLEMCDVLAYFIEGRLVYYGPPDSLKRHFGVDNMREIYVKAGEKSAEQWEVEFRETDDYSEFVEKRASPPEASERTMFRRGKRISNAPRRSASRQYHVLRKRYMNLLFGDAKSTALILGMAPLIALLMCLVVSKGSVGWEVDLAGKLAMAMVFLGIFGSIREIVKELAIYRHERFVNLQIVPYLASKAVPLGVLAGVQALEILAVVHLVIQPGDPLLLQWLVLWLTGLAGMLLGLAISAAVATADKAVMFMILAVIPQILLLHPPTDGAKMVARLLIVAYWGAQGLADIAGSGKDPVTLAIPVLVVLSGIYAAMTYFFMRRKDGSYGRF